MKNAICDGIFCINFVDKGILVWESTIHWWTSYGCIYSNANNYFSLMVKKTGEMIKTIRKFQGKKMCLAIPGKILKIDEQANLPMGEVDFSGVKKSVCLAFTPEAKVGDYVIVHVGFAIGVLDEKGAQATLDLLQ
jgi:hydrogenase expression/formation protein HypC